MIGHIHIVAILLELWCALCWVFVYDQMRRQVLAKDCCFGDWDYLYNKKALFEYWGLLKAHGKHYPASSLRLSSGLFLVAMLAVVLLFPPPWW